MDFGDSQNGDSQKLKYFCTVNRRISMKVLLIILSINVNGGYQQIHTQWFPSMDSCNQARQELQDMEYDLLKEYAPKQKPTVEHPITFQTRCKSFN